MTLTSRQEAFVRGLVSGMTQRKAYRAAYGAERMADRTVDKRACELFAREAVKARYAALTDEVAASVQWDRARAARELLAVMDEAMEKIRATRCLEVSYTEAGARQVPDLPPDATRALIRAVAELNRMFGVYEERDADARVVIVYP
ncbi:MAG: hypothetical protein EG823_03705 [Actinobacteria bacterium]|nr:hypothetical protein [Actinomycetota bacterium]